MVGEESVLVDWTEDVTLGKEISFSDFGRLEVPEFGGVEWWDINSSGYEDGLGVLGDDLERSLNTVKDLVEDTGAEFDSKRLFSSFDGISDSETGWS